MSEHLSGRYFAAGANASVAATLRLNGAELVSIDSQSFGDNEMRQISGKVAEISHRLGHVPRKITLEDHSVFETSDNDGVDHLFGVETGFVKRLTQVEGSFKLVAILVVCTVLALVGIYRYGLPAMANGAAQLTPARILVLMDSGTLTTVDKLFFEPSELAAARQNEISEQFADLAAQSGQTKPPLRLLFRDGGALGANAIALPGGTVIITDQLIAVARSDDEILGVLGHEIGHVEYRHSARQIYRVLGIGFMLSIVGGDSGQLVEDVIAQAAALDNLSFSRKFETEADFRSAELMVALDRDPFAFIDLLKRITHDNGEEKESGWLSSHPGTFDRTLTVQKFVDSLDK